MQKKIAIDLNEFTFDAQIQFEITEEEKQINRNLPSHILPVKPNKRSNQIAKKREEQGKNDEHGANN